MKKLNPGERWKIVVYPIAAVIIVYLIFILAVNVLFQGLH